MRSLVLLFGLWPLGGFADAVYPHVALTPAFDSTVEQRRPSDAYARGGKSDVQLTQWPAEMREAEASYRRIDKLEPHQVVFLTAEIPMVGGPVCQEESADPSRCDWHVPLISCGDYQLLQMHEKDGEMVLDANLDASCRPVLIVRQRPHTAHHRVVTCHRSHFVLYGFYAIRYMQGHFGQLFYEAMPAEVPPEWAWATLEQHKASIRCQP